MRRLILILLSCLSSFLWAQDQPIEKKQVEGFVRDIESREPLIGATVYANELIAAFTDENGFFRISVPAAQKFLLVSYVGYSADTLWINADKLEMLLRENSRFLEPVVVSAGKQSQREVETTVSISTIQPYLIQNRITSSIENTLQQIPGVTSTDGQANIRSGSGWSYGTGSRVSVLVDGMPMLAAGTGQALWSFFPIENIQQVEVIKGSSSVLYGSSALNGVINILTAWPGNKELISASMYAGVYDKPAKPGWNWKPPSETFLTKTGGHVLYGKGYERFQYVFSINGLIDEGYRMGDQDKRIRMSGKTRFYSKDKKWNYGINTNLLYGKTGSFLLWERYDLAYTSLDSTYGLNSSRRFNLDPYAEYHGIHTEHFLQMRLYDVVNGIEQVDGEPDQSNATHSIYTEYRIKWKQLQSKGLLVNTGLVTSYGETNATMFQGQRVQQNHAAYVQGDYKYGRWNISAGARYEQFRLEQYTEGKPVFKAGVNYRAAKATFLRASFGQGYRFPVVSESYIKTSAGPVTIYPNTELKSESGYSMEFGVRQGFQTESGIKFMADLAFYRMYFENMMEFTFAQWGSPFDPLFGLGFKSINIGPSLIQGAEITLTGGGEWRKNEFRMILGYTYADPQNLKPDYVYSEANGAPNTYKSTSSDSTGTILKYRNRHLIKADIQWERTRYGLGMSYRYTSRFEAIDNAFMILIDGVKESYAENNKGSHVIDFRAFYHINADWKITGTINNVFNAVVLSRPCDIEAPRNFMCQFSYRY